MGQGGPQTSWMNWRLPVRLVGGLVLLCGVATSTVAAAAGAEAWHAKAEARMAGAVARHEAIAAAGGWPSVPAGASLKPGATDGRVPTLRHRLVVSGDLAGPAPAGAVYDPAPAGAVYDPAPAGAVYDPALIAAVEAFQARHGLAIDGVVGPQTLAALNEPVENRLAALRRNQARMQRFQPQHANYVLVNIPGFEARLVRGADADLSMNVVVGLPSWPTPTLSSTLDHLVINPAWYVPPRIQSRELIPHAQRDPAYLTRKNIQVYKDGQRLDPASVDWWSPEARGYRLRQPPGARNALGKVKFMFDNRYHVYMHDTPSKHLFQRPQRAFSHGCVRLEKPLELARALLQDDAGWDAARFDAAFASRRMRTVKLEQPVGVEFVYWTAWVDEAGTVQFRHDLYQRDTGAIPDLTSEGDAVEARS